MRLVKYLASSGVASRRGCEVIIRSGRVDVNGRRVTNPFLLLEPHDIVSLDGDVVVGKEDMIVIVLNKPKGIITTVNDPYNRKTVLDLVDLGERIFPVGRLDKDTTGVLLLTNDGDLAYRLTHPKFGIEKVYGVIIDRPLTDSDKWKIELGVDIGEGEVGEGVVLERGQLGSGGTRRPKGTVRLSLSRGKKREIRRIFKALGYRILALGRESFAGITAEGLMPGEWRKLEEDELARLVRTGVGNEAPQN